MAYNNNVGSDENPYMTGTHGEDQDTLDFDYQDGSEYSHIFTDDLPDEMPSDWTFSHPTWQGSPHTVSPPSSAEVSPNSSWNPLEQPFASIQTSIDNGALIPSGTSYFSTLATSHQAPCNSFRQGGTHCYVSPAAINGTTTFKETDQEGHTPTAQTNDNAHLPSQNADFSSYQSFHEAARTRCRDSVSSRSASQSSSKTVTTSKRRKSLKQEPRPTANSSKSNPPSHLRSKQPSQSITFGSSPSSNSNNSSETKSRKGSRTCHNDVEKQYRNRLNSHFEMLLQTLPKDGDRDGERNVSKAEVLVLAKRRIHQLERENRLLEKEKEELRVSVKEMKRKWLGMEGDDIT